jgi:hypothetical protein
MRTPAEIEAEARRLEAAPYWEPLQHAAAQVLRDRLSPGQVETAAKTGNLERDRARMHAALWAWGVESDPPSVALS